MFNAVKFKQKKNLDLKDSIRVLVSLQLVPFSPNCTVFKLIRRNEGERPGRAEKAELREGDAGS